MSHARTQIRQAVVAMLTGNTAAGNRVFTSRVYPLDNPKLPALLVSTPQENMGNPSMQRPRTQQRTPQLVIEGYVKARGDIEAEADALAVQVEQIIGADPALGGRVKDTMLDSTVIRLSGDGETPVAIITLTFAVLYCTKENAPQTLV